jgi:AspT/YidE/YbjL antiporter-like protein
MFGWMDYLAPGMVAHAVLALSVVAALGLVLGSLGFRGIRLGAAGVLFAGLLLGQTGLHIDQNILEFGRDFGLILFVYTVGLQVGPSFFSSLKRRGLQLNLLASTIVLLGGLMVEAFRFLFRFSLPTAAGLFSGATTNTPSLAAGRAALLNLKGLPPGSNDLLGMAYAHREATLADRLYASGEMSVPVTQTAGSILTTLDSHKPILQRMLSPKVVALVGATEAPNSVGRTLMENLLSFGENLYPINPKRPTVLGVKAFPKIADVPAAIDLAVIATPAFTPPDVISECEKAAVPGAVIISAGFKECGAAGIKLEEEILARKGPMRLIGPNCLGVMIPELGLNATFAKRMGPARQRSIH